MDSARDGTRLERDLLRLAVRALGELAVGPARAKGELFAELLPALCGLLRASGAMVAERVSISARGEPALRVLAVHGLAAPHYTPGDALSEREGALARALAARAPAREPGAQGAPARIVIPLCARGELLGALELLGGDGELRDDIRATLDALGAACGELMLGYERAARRARAAEDLQRSQRHLRRSASLDGLTGLANRACSESGIADAAERSRAAGLPLALVVVDLDHAKAVADALGASGFDEAITAVARVIHDTVRPSDWTGRLSVDAFVITLLGCDAASAALVAERLRLRIEGVPVLLRRGDELPLSVSAGVASTLPTPENGAALLVRALRALDEAKRAGRNRVCVSRPAQS